ncbi:chemoreceptor glutamine deamidase CheD [Pontibacterium sp.]|uniref:chemoreceptor glutamine deamidase CheD n=1 Tax=Pontibacterium sp. TaxID=2036026 RepID=UPI0035158638
MKGLSSKWPTPEPVLPGFEAVHRFWDAPRSRFIAKILPGQFYVTKNQEVIATILGSCISVCIRDAQAGIGGMNHFLLPGGSAQNVHDEIVQAKKCARYGIYAMDMLMKHLLRYGAHKENLEVKVTGGARIISANGDVGEHNIAFIREYLEIQGLKIVAEDVAGSMPRKVLYFPDSGKLMVKKLADQERGHVRRREDKFIHTIEDSG